ncbi:hypothetical protein CBL_09001 [Carabus blaptoides fortunei]
MSLFICEYNKHITYYIVSTGDCEETGMAQFRCCPPVPHGGGCTLTAINRRSLHGLSGGGLVQDQPPNNHFNPKSNMLFTQSAAQCRSAQISPSAPVSFVLPFPPTAQLDPAESRPETEFQRLKESVRLLQESGWYHEGLSWQQSQAALKGTAPGTFLIRDSSDPKFLYALSVQTEQGPTSVRLHYVNGKFRLDSEPYLAPLMPLFSSVLDLCVYYVKCSVRNSTPPHQNSLSAGGGQVWVDANGCLFSRILLRRPLLRADRVPTLQHLARLAVHGALEKSARPRLALLPPPHTQLELPTRLAEYLAEYPYSL